MAEFLTKKVSELVEATTLGDNDLIPISQADGLGGFISKHVKGVNVGGGGELADLAEDPANTAGLTWGWLAGQVRSDNVITNVAAGTLSLTDNAANYVEYTVAGGMTVNQSAFTSGSLPIRTVVTSAGAQTSSVDERAWLNDLADYYNKANILGTVSQTGGVPTGALMEYGSNANGEYWKYAGGMMICTKAHVFEFATAGINTGYTPWTYPAAFIAVPSNLPPGVYSSQGSSDYVDRFNVFTTLTNGDFRIETTVSAIKTLYVKTFAIGRWF